MWFQNLNFIFGGWHTGVTVSGVLLAENRHHHNQGCAECRVDGHPLIRHYDTRLVDLLQRLVHTKIMAALYIHTGQMQVTSRTPTKNWYGCLTQLESTPGVRKSVWSYKLEKYKADTRTKDHQPGPRCQIVYVAICHNRGEDCLHKKSFRHLLKTEEKLAIWWCNHIDEINMFPKLTVYFCMHMKKWVKGNQIENTVKTAKKGADKLKEIN